VTNSLMQYNYAHDNDGAGYLLCQYAGASVWSGNTIRHNVSINDGRKNGYAGIHVVNAGSGLDDARIHDNVVLMDTRQESSGAVKIGSGSRGFLMYDNAIMSIGGERSVVVDRGQKNLRILHNHCWSQAGPTLQDGPRMTDSNDLFHTRQEAKSCVP